MKKLFFLSCIMLTLIAEAASNNHKPKAGKRQRTPESTRHPKPSQASEDIAKNLLEFIEASATKSSFDTKASTTKSSFVSKKDLESAFFKHAQFEINSFRNQYPFANISYRHRLINDQHETQIILKNSGFIKIISATVDQFQSIEDQYFFGNFKVLLISEPINQK